MYFNHAYRKAYLGTASGGNLVTTSTGTTASLTAGQLGFFDAKTFNAVAPLSLTGKPFIIAQGSWYKSAGYNDKIGPYHGGYQESVKTKVINPKYITRVFTTCATPAVQQVVSIGWDLTAGGDGFLFECGMTYRLRIDLKGSPALRFLSHNVYNTVDSYSGCCTDDCTATCTGAPVDAACVLLGWKDQIYRNPWMTEFILPQVYVKGAGGANVEVYSAADVEAGRNSTSFTANTATNTTLNVTAMGTGSNPIAIGMAVTGAGVTPGTTISAFGTGSGGIGTYTLSAPTTATATGVSMTATKAAYTCATVNPENVVAGLKLTVAYEDTKFGICTFTPTDFYEVQPLQIFTSITDDSGDPCSIKPIANSSTGEFVTEITAPAQAQGLGETVMRDLILDARYRQEAYPDSMNVNHLRMREIESNPVLLGTSGQTIRTSLYDSINILHSVPRFNNPTGTFDNDQYLITIYVPQGTNCVAFLNGLQTAINCAGTQVGIEHWPAGGACAGMTPTVAADYCLP